MRYLNRSRVKEYNIFILTVHSGKMIHFPMKMCNFDEFQKLGIFELLPIFILDVLDDSDFKCLCPVNFR